MSDNLYSDEDRAAGERLFKFDCSFVKGVVDIDGLPGDGKMEVAFAGRSNVGKSSLLNALVGRKALARISNTPGRTREINFFALGDKLYLVDMPGYGYARAPKAQIKGWTRLIQDYLKGRAALARVFLLLDARHGVKDTDLAIMTLLDDAAVSYQAVMTKGDKLKQSERLGVFEKTAAILSRRPAAHPLVIVTSARKRTGLIDLRAAVAVAVPGAA